MIGEPLHDLVYFIGDKPSAKNLRQNVPFVGTASYKTLLNWIAICDLDITRIRLFNQSDAPFDEEASRFLRDVKVIALGNIAANYLKTTGIEDYFILPHPSPANKAAHKDLTNKLYQCKMYVYS